MTLKTMAAPRVDVIVRVTPPGDTLEDAGRDLGDSHYSEDLYA
jgi:hypothetical protein